MIVGSLALWRGVTRDDTIQPAAGNELTACVRRYCPLLVARVERFRLPMASMEAG